MTKNNTTTAPRKTAKYYRDILSGSDMYKAIAVLPEVIRKYGHKRWSGDKQNNRIIVKEFTEFEWNHTIEGFFLSDKGVLFVDIYWQGDSTDGNDSLTAREAMYGKVIPAEHEFLGNRTYYRHGDLRITAEEFRNAVHAVAKWLSPEEVKKRKIAAERNAREERIDNLVKEHAPKTKRTGWGRDEDWERYWNGKTGVEKLLRKEPELIDKPFEEVAPIVEKVYANNAKSDYALRGGWCNGEKEYDLSY